jgi:hypothetical protein
MKTNLRYKWARIKAALGGGADIDVMLAYRDKAPHKIDVQITREGEWWTAVVKKINGNSIKNASIATQGKTMPELIEMINDAVYTYLGFPIDVVIKMPTLLPADYEPVPKSKSISLSVA